MKIATVIFSPTCQNLNRVTIMKYHLVQLQFEMLFTEEVDANTKEEAIQIGKDRVMCAMRRLSAENNGMFCVIDMKVLKPEGAITHEA